MLKELKVIKPKIYRDERGFFYESWNKQQFLKEGIDDIYLEEDYQKLFYNHIQNLSYQLNNPQGRLIEVLKGSVFIAVVDLRVHSPTFSKSSSSLILENCCAYVFPGFAQGLYVLSKEVELISKLTTYSSLEDKFFIDWSDPSLEIPWPIEDKPILLNEKAEAVKFSEAKYYL